MASTVATATATVGTTQQGPMHERRQARTGKHLYAGFVSGLTSSVILQPLDLLKTRVQQAQGGTLSAAMKEIKSVGSLWRGTVPSALRTSIGSALYFTTLNYTRTYMANVFENSNGNNSDKQQRASSKLPSLSMHANLLSGSFVRGVVGFATMPITVVKVRYESSVYRYTSILAACRQIFKQHGVPGFFYGFGVTFARDAPYAGLYMLFYEKSKDVANRLVFSRTQSVENTSTKAAFLVNSSSAVFSATAATTITAPFDTIKTRVQLDPVKYPSFWRSLKLMVKEERGVRSLFDGVSLRLARKAMSAGIAWCIYEEIVRRV